jgi:CubicO group peptidase (beta-lactamase class C family)
LISVLIVAVSGFVDIPKVKQGDVDAFAGYVDKTVSDYISRNGKGAVAIGIIHNGKIFLVKGYGYQDAEQKIPVTEDTVFQVASISKSFTAWAIMDLVEEGVLELDQPVTKYIPDWHFPPSDFDENEVTIRRMLSHSSGIANVGGYAGVEKREDLQTLHESLISANDARGEGVRIVYQPGSKYDYSGGAYTLLQYVIEQTTGQPFERYMQEKILDPLKMEHSSFSYDKTAHENLAVVYDNAGIPVPAHYFASQAAAGLYTTIGDISKWALAILSAYDEKINNPVLNPETLKSMFQPQKAPKSLLPYGLGYMIQEIGTNKTLEVSHTGGNLPNWHSVVTTLPEKGEGLIVLTNTAGGLSLRKQLQTDWLIWVCGEDSLGGRINRMIDAGIYVVPGFLISMAAILVWGRLRKRRNIL